MNNHRKKREYLRSILFGVVGGLALAIVFSAGFVIRDLLDMPSVFASTSASNENSESGYALLLEVQGLLDNHYLREQPSYTQRQYDAIRGLLGGLNDRSTFFIEPPVARSESDALAGTYGGIGVNVQRNVAGEFVLYPFDDSPAEEAGVSAGDVLIAVNGEALNLSTQSDIVDQMLRGEVRDDNGVELTLRRDDEEIVLFVPFDVINIPSVQWRVLEQDERLGYVQIIRFTSRTPSEIEEALTDLIAEDIAGVILDLRDNFGGLLQEAVEIAGIFLDGGIVLYEVRNTGEREFEAEQGVTVDLPLIVLVNRGTASASELLAGALQDRGGAVLIGQNTFGKGTIQQIFQLSDSSSVHVTSAEWLTPNRNQIDGIGLEPDIAMIPDEDGRDVEIEEAIRYLQGLFE
ncbi:MAG: S41 family peptidase [Anaerolineaceae bacterium]|nr:MAG: S41 family peptidase [Anaerolineaceae bacterium]